MKKVVTMLLSDEKKEFINNALKDNDNYILEDVKVMNVNSERFVIQLAQKYKDHDFMILGFEVFKNDVVKIIENLRSIERLINTKCIILLDNLDESLIYEFTLNGISNFVNVGNEKLLMDILDGKVDLDYEYNLETEKELNTDYIFDFEVANIHIQAMNDDFLSFLVAVNLTNYLNTINSSNYFINYQPYNYLDELVEFNAMKKLDEMIYKYDDEKSKTIYSYEEMPPLAQDEACICVYDSGIDDIQINSDIKILVSSSSFEDITLIEESQIEKGKYYFIINPVKEIFDKIKDRDDVKQIKKIKSLSSIENFEVFEQILEENKLISYF